MTVCVHLFLFTRGIEFFHSIAETMVSPTNNWLQHYQQDLELDNKAHSANENIPRKCMDLADECTPISLNNFPLMLSTKIKVCQVCHYEMWEYK
jgi:hypothetical protein